MTTSQWQDVTGFTAIGADGDKIGKVGQVYLNDATGQLDTGEHVGSGEIDALYQHYAGYLDPAGS